MRRLARHCGPGCAQGWNRSSIWRNKQPRSRRASTMTMRRQSCAPSHRWPKAPTGSLRRKQLTSAMISNARCHSIAGSTATILRTRLEIFAEEAIDLGYDLECPLPFDCREYRNDFADEISKRQFDELLAKAKGTVFELDGSRKDAPAAYALVGELVLDQCDILLAIWDGKNAKGEGGTAEVVAHAKRRRIPVVWLHSDSGALDTIITSNGSEDCGRVTCGGIDERIKDAVWRLLLPPRNPDPVGSLHLTERLLAPVLVRVWRLYETALTAGLRRSRSPADAPPESLAIHGFQKQYASWDRSANLLAGLYRGAFLLNRSEEHTSELQS